MPIFQLLVVSLGCRTLWASSNPGEASSFHCLPDGSSLHCGANKVRSYLLPFSDFSFLFEQSFLIEVSKKILFRSSRVASRGIVLADSQSDDVFGNDAWESNRVNSPVMIDNPTTSSSERSVSAITSLKQKIYRLWFYAVQRWPAVLIVLLSFIKPCI